MPELEQGELGGISEVRKGFHRGLEVIEWGLRSRPEISSCVRQSSSLPTASFCRGRIPTYRDKISLPFLPTLFYEFST